MPHPDFWTALNVGCSARIQHRCHSATSRASRAVSYLVEAAELLGRLGRWWTHANIIRKILKRSAIWIWYDICFFWSQGYLVYHPQTFLSPSGGDCRCGWFPISWSDFHKSTWHSWWHIPSVFPLYCQHIQFFWWHSPTFFHVPWLGLGLTPVTLAQVRIRLRGSRLRSAPQFWF